MIQTTPRVEDSVPGTLYVALELSNRSWKLALTDGQKKREVSVPGGNVAALVAACCKAKARLGLEPESPVLSCYEAGRDGFWLHRALERAGVRNLVIDASSIEVDRRFRRTKTDRLDAWRLLGQLVRYAGGERSALRPVHVPSVEDEDARRPERELQRLRKERTAHANRMRGLLALHGLRLVLGPRFAAWLREARGADGQPIPPQLQAELRREHARWGLVSQQLRTLEAERRAQLAQEGALQPRVRRVQHLAKLCGIGVTGADVLVHEFFGWRRFTNRRQVGAATGLVPSLYASGERSTEQGISKAGNRRVRATLIQLAWGWLRYQPDSALSQWFRQRFAGSARLRRIGIVALARRLIIALWRYVQAGVIPDGARFKAVPTAS